MTATPITRSRRQRGITLLEMLLVLGLLVAIAAIAMPSVNRPLETYRLRKSGDLIRAEWAKARAKAMESGRTYVFRYEPDADGYQIEPWYSDEDYLESSELTSVSGFGTSVTAPTPLVFDQASVAAMKQLPEDIVFFAGETEQEARALLAAQGTASLVNQDTTMSAPIFFYPDGTSSTAKLFIKSNRERYIKLTLRGLTGVVYVSDFLTAEQVE
ncbi:MAG: prepilin-type N-terminal cleavage/methylation domain-containing protein [Planctomycetes bacterium]|nr:prepilin-type N-terminal cleavage/methylation domain-containing protein [Planctomycetota bacterium]